MARLLSRYKLSTEISGDGFDALKKYASEPFDLIIMDLHLPKLSGVEVIRKIRSTNRGEKLPVIVVTGVYKGGEYANKALDVLGIEFYLEKPFSQEAFLNAIKRSLGSGAENDKPPGDRAEMEGPAPPPAAATVSSQEIKPAEPPAPAPSVSQRAPEPSPTDSEPRPATVPRQVAEIKPRQALRGRFHDMPIDTLLIESSQNRATGLLFIKNNDDEHSLLFINGVPMGISASSLECSFGNHLFANGKISLMEYQVYQNQDRNGDDPDQIFIKMGCLLPDEFFAEWKRYLEESLIRMFGWDNAEFTFQLWPSLPETSPLPHVNLPHIIHEGYKRHVAKERIAGFREKAAGRFIALAPAYYDHQMHIVIDPAESLFLDRSDGSRSFEELLPSEPSEAEQVVRSFGAFLALGMVEIKDAPQETEIEAPYPIRERTVERELPEDEEEEAAAPAAAPEPEAMEDQGQKDEELIEFLKGLKKKSYYEIFGMKTGQFDFSMLKKEYFRLTKQFSPENFITSPGEVLEKAEQALSALATAYNTLSNVVSKEKYDEMMAGSIKATGIPGGGKDQDKMQAEVAYQSGMAFLKMSDWVGAEKALAEAVSLAPKNGDIIAHYSYALYNKNRQSKVIQKRVQELLAQALKAKPKCAPAFAYRGAMLLEEDKVSLAEADFNKALSINPRYKLALKGIKRVERKRQDEKKGLFGRFRK
jgi:CheY-like chemotaxis protein/tetratricopeptide (TPR) repeat protein